MKHLYIITAFLLCCLCIKAQEPTQKESTITISGTVLDEFNAPIPGANVFLKDRPGVGTVTNMDGKFTIKGAQMGDVITLSFLGYEKQEVRIDSRLDRKNAQFKLKPSTNTLEETVVVGLGSQRKVSVVGAITNVDVKDLQTPATSIPNMLGGRVPGIISLQNSGEPGKNISEFWVRGIGTFGANQGALVLIDGLEGSLSQIDPADIESFSVLKDASATAVYGTRGANGVVLVTTKRGEVDKLKITGRANLTVSHLQNMPEYLGAYDYATLANEAKLARGEEALYSPMALDLIKYQLDPDLYPNVNWRDQILNKNSLQQTYYMSARGGGSVARYFFSLGIYQRCRPAFRVLSSNFPAKGNNRFIDTIRISPVPARVYTACSAFPANRDLNFKRRRPFCACIPIGVSCTEVSDTMISSRAQAIMNSPNTDRNNVLNCIIQNFN